MFNKRFLNDTIDLTLEQARTWKKRASEADAPKGLIQEVEKNQRPENFKKALTPRKTKAAGPRMPGK